MLGKMPGRQHDAANPEDMMDAVNDQSGTEGKKSGGRRILLVEDDLHVAETLAELLGLEGFNVTVAHDAESGLARARAEPPDMILCDLTLPGGVDGHAFARACRSDAALRLVRLIAVSGYCGAQDRARALKSGFDDLIGKPIELDRVHASFRPARGALD